LALPRQQLLFGKKMAPIGHHSQASRAVPLCKNIVLMSGSDTHLFILMTVIDSEYLLIGHCPRQAPFSDDFFHAGGYFALPKISYKESAECTVIRLLHASLDPYAFHDNFTSEL